MMKRFDREKESTTLLINKVTEKIILAYKNAENRINHLESKLEIVQNAENRRRYGKSSHNPQGMQELQQKLAQAQKYIS